MTAFCIILAASPVLLLGAVAFVVFIAAGIRKGDNGKRLTGNYDGIAEAVARRVLTGSRGFDTCDERIPLNSSDQEKS